MNLKLPTTLLLTGLLAGVAPGCSNSISGQIDGEGVAATNGFFIQAEEGDYGVILVFLTNVRNSCETYAAYLDDWEDSDLSDEEEQAELWAEYMPNEFWTTEITIITDPGDDLTDEEFDGADVEDMFFGNLFIGPGLDEASAQFNHYLKPLDEDYWSSDEDVDEEDYVLTFLSDGGDLIIKKHVEDESISGTFETTAVELDDFDDVGDVTAKFKVDRCDDVEDQLY